jgi:hypothetical protein
VRRLGLAAVLAALLLPAPAAADTFRVTTTSDGTGCSVEGCALRGAVLLAEEIPGADTIIVPAGNYELLQGPLTPSNDMTITGEGARNSILDANGRSRIFDIDGGTVEISHLTMQNGFASAAAQFHGGNLRNSGATVTLDNVRVTGGSASSAGGVSNNSGTMVIDHSLLDHNSALMGGGDGGAIMNHGGEPGQIAPPGILTVRNTTITANTANLAGALIERDNAANRTTLINVTIAGNSAGFRGQGGISFGEVARGQIDVHGSVIAGNTQTVAGQTTESNCSAPPSNLGANISSSGECGFLTTDPLLGALSDLGGETDVLPLAAGSPALDLQTTCATATDQRGLLRPQGTACDAGAYELEVPFAVPAQPPTIRDADRDGVADDTDNCVDVANSGQADADADRFGDACDLLPPGNVPAVAGVNTVVRLLSGEVFVKLPARASTRAPFQESGFVPLKGVASLPVGSVVDTRKGRMALESAANSRPVGDRRRRIQAATFAAGIFRIRQQRARRASNRRIPTDAVLVSGAGAERVCTRRAGAGPPKGVVRRLTMTGKGLFRAVAGASVGTARDATWITTDRCDGTLTEVGRGRVSLKVRGRRRPVRVRAGRAYLVRARLFAAKKGRNRPGRPLA